MRTILFLAVLLSPVPVLIGVGIRGLAAALGASGVELYSYLFFPKLPEWIWRFALPLMWTGWLGAVVGAIVAARGSDLANRLVMAASLLLYCFWTLLLVLVLAG